MDYNNILGCITTIKGDVIKTKQYDKNLKDCWDSVGYDMIDYPSVETALQNFDQDFVNELPLLDKNFISNILNNIP